MILENTLIDLRIDRSPLPTIFGTIIHYINTFQIGTYTNPRNEILGA